MEGIFIRLYVGVDGKVRVSSNSYSCEYEYDCRRFVRDYDGDMLNFDTEEAAIEWANANIEEVDLAEEIRYHTYQPHLRPRK